jgi:hypothetical protein
MAKSAKMAKAAATQRLGRRHGQRTCPRSLEYAPRPMGSAQNARCRRHLP